MLTPARAWSLVIALATAGCAVGNDIGSEAIGVYVHNDCASPLLASAGHTADVAIERFESSPIAIVYGRASHVSVIKNAAADPQAYFLAFGVDASDPDVREFDIDRLDDELTRVTFAADCSTLAEQPPNG